MKTKTIEVEVGLGIDGWAKAFIIPNTFIRIIGQVKTGVEVVGWEIRYDGNYEEQVKKWLLTLSQSKYNEFASIRGPAAERMNEETRGILIDWLIDHGCPQGAIDRVGNFWCTTKLQPIYTTFSRTFNIGDLAEESGYNVSYYGPIIAIGPTIVTIDGQDGQKFSRLSLKKFIERNWDFDVDKASAHNQDCRD